MWYRVIRAAKYLGVAPWDLAAQPMVWVERAETAQAAEAHAQNARGGRQQQR